MEARKVALFRSGRSQAVRIPRDFELPGTEAIMRREEGRLVIEPAGKRSLLALLAEFEPIEEDLAEVEDKPPEPVSL